MNEFYEHWKHEMRKRKNKYDEKSKSYYNDFYVFTFNEKICERTKHFFDDFENVSMKATNEKSKNFPSDITTLKIQIKNQDKRYKVIFELRRYASDDGKVLINVDFFRYNEFIKSYPDKKYIFKEILEILMNEYKERNENRIKFLFKELKFEMYSELRRKQYKLDEKYKYTL